MEKGKIIFLNGVSSSGKTTIAKALQDTLIDSAYYISNDLFANMIPPNHFKNGKIDEIFNMMYNIIKLFSDLNRNIIVDSLFLSTHRMNQCIELLHEHPVLLVHVKCPSEELRRREEKRIDREIGQGESQLDLLCPKDTYDVVIDTYKNTINECVNKIIVLLNHPEKFSSFKILWKKFITIGVN